MNVLCGADSRFKGTDAGERKRTSDRCTVVVDITMIPSYTRNTSRGACWRIASSRGQTIVRKPANWRAFLLGRRLSTFFPRLFSPTPGLEHLRLIHPRDSQPFHRSRQIFADFK